MQPDSHIRQSSKAPQRPHCNRCLSPEKMVPGLALVPTWFCRSCGREIPRV